MKKLITLLVVAWFLIFPAGTNPTSAFYGLPVKPKPRIIPPLGLGGAIVGGTILFGGFVVTYIHLCSKSPGCLEHEERAQEAGKELALARQELMNCAAGGACTPARVQEVEARAGKARERQKEEKARARLLAIADARRSPKSGAPGFCEQDKYSNLKFGVDSSCKTLPLACNWKMSKLEMTERRERATKCAQARDRINYECFKGGDDSHNNEASRAWNVVKECDNQLLEQFGRGR